MIHPCFDFCEESLSTFLKMTHGFIAGSAALHAYLDERFAERGPECELLDWTPGDMDIWIPVPSMTKEKILEARDIHERGELDPTRTPAIFTLTDFAVHFMKDHGWERTIDHEFHKHYMAFRDSCPYIMRIFHFTSEKCKQRIQIIFTADVPPATILDTFDLSGCKVAWNPTGRFNLTPPEILDQLAKEPSVMYIKTPSVKLDDERTRQRIAKYQRRGFTIYIRAPEITL